MKVRSNIRKAIKPLVAIVLVSTMVSSCVVKAKPRKPPPPATKVIIKP